VNRVFLTGTMKTKPEVVYTPRGEKYVLFPLWVDDGGFRIDVEWTPNKAQVHLSEKVGKVLMVSGMLMKARAKSQDAFKLKAHKIYWMEE